MSIVWPITARETMAKTKRHLGAPRVAQLPPAGMRAKIKRVKAPIGDLEGFDPQSVQTRPDPRINVSEGSIDEAPIDTFAYDTPQHNFAEELLLSVWLGTVTSSRRCCTARMPVPIRPVCRSRCGPCSRSIASSDASVDSAVLDFENRCQGKSPSWQCWLTGSRLPVA